MWISWTLEPNVNKQYLLGAIWRPKVRCFNIPGFLVHWDALGTSVTELLGRLEDA